MDSNPFADRLNNHLDEQLISSVLKNDRLGMLSCLIRGADVDTLEPISPLMIACMKGYTSLVDVLLYHKADILRCDIHGKNSLKITLEREPGKVTRDIIRVLLSHLDTPDISKDDDGLTSIDYAIQNGDILTFQLMLDYRYVVEYETAFKEAAFHNKYEMLLFLIQMCGFPLSQRHKNDILYEGCRGGHTSMMSFALGCGAVFEPSKHYLLVACETFDISMVRYVLQKGVPFDPCALTWVASIIDRYKHNVFEGYSPNHDRNPTTFNEMLTGYRSLGTRGDISIGLYGGNSNIFTGYPPAGSQNTFIGIQSGYQRPVVVGNRTYMGEYIPNSNVFGEPLLRNMVSFEQSPVKIQDRLPSIYEIYFTLKRYTKPYDIHQGIHNCCICYNDTLFNHAKTSCDHIYCIPCINTWLKDHTTCPLCRKVIHA